MKKIQANVKVVIGLGVAVGILFIVVWGIISQHNQELRRREDEEADRRIVCYPGDFEDTKFIRELKENETILLPPKSRLRALSREELAFLYHRYIENIQYLCKRKARLGSIDDGGWDVCDETAHQPKQPCLAYSFGINNDFSFDDAVIQKYGCEVHSFDPSMGTESYRRNSLNHFHAMGIAGTDRRTEHGWELLTFTSIQKKLGHQERKISILKLDVERWEWDVLPDMIRSGVLKDVVNLAIEFHLEMHSPEQGKEVYFTALSILKDLYDEGFRIFWTHQNKWCRFISRCRGELRTNCHEVNFVKIQG